MRCSLEEVVCEREEGSGSESWALCQVLWSVRGTADGGSLSVDFEVLW